MNTLRNIGRRVSVAGRGMLFQITSILLTIPDFVAAIASLVFHPIGDFAVSMHHRRLAAVRPLPDDQRPTGWRLNGFLILRATLGTITLVVAVVMTFAFSEALAIFLAATVDFTLPTLLGSGRGKGWIPFLVTGLPSLLLVVFGTYGFVGLYRLELRLWKACSRPSGAQLTEQVSALSETLGDVVEVIDGERRRIERDIHDGVQQRVVALALLLGRAQRETDPDLHRGLEADALVQTQQILDDLRDVSWRVYPAMLDNDGLPSALAALRHRTQLPITLDIQMDRREPRAVETAIYFVVSEAVTNALKHAEATAMTVSVHQASTQVLVVITDDGIGGADPLGPGLAGVGSRVRAVSGSLTVTSPAGGPTILRAEFPCES